MHRRWLPVAALALAVLGISGCSSNGASPDTTTTAPQPHTIVSDLLALHDLGSGWSIAPVSGTSGVGCLKNLLAPHGVVEQTSAQVRFVQKHTGAFVEEKLVIFSGSVASAFEKVLHDVSSCHRISGKLGGVRAHGTVSKLHFPSIGDGSAAYRVSVSAAGARATEQAVFVRKGVLVMGLLEGVSGSSLPTSFERIVQAAVAKL